MIDSAVVTASASAASVRTRARPAVGRSDRRAGGGPDANVRSVLIMLPLLLPGFAAGQSYTLLPIDPLPGSSAYAWPTAINNGGTVVGYAPTAGGAVHAFRWTRSGGTQDLGDLPGGADDSAAFDINDQGVIAGHASEASGRCAVLWQGDAIRSLGVPAGMDATEARGVNARGQVAGTSTGASGRRAFFWDSAGGFHEVGVPAGYAGSEGLALNDHGQVVGVAAQGQQLSAFRWSDAGGTQDLGDLPEGAHVSYAYAINNDGHVVGRGNVVEGDRAVLWRFGGLPADLGIPPGGYNSYAYGINVRGHVVGDTTGVGGHRASIWYTPDEDSVDLNTLVDPVGAWHLVAAYDINDVGQIIGMGVSPQGAFSAFVLNPLPEVAGFWPNSVDLGPTIFVFGSGFVPNETQVSVAGVPCPAVQWMSGDMVIALRPSGVASGAVAVSTPFGSAMASGNYGEPQAGLSVSALWPSQGSAFDFIFLFGSGFSSEGTQVSLSGTPAYAVQVLSDSLLIFMVPGDAASGPVEVMVGADSASSPEPFTIY